MDCELDLHSQVLRLRRSLRQTQCIAVLLFLGIGGLEAAHWLKPVHIVEANTFLLKDGDGNIVGRLGDVGFGDTCLTLTAADHSSAAELCVQRRNGSVLDLHNMKSEARAMFTPGFDIVEPLQRMPPQLLLSSTSDRPSINLVDADGKPVRAAQ